MCIYHGSEVKGIDSSLVVKGLGCWVFLAWPSIPQSVCEWAFSLQAIWCLRLPGFESCIQQRTINCLLSIRNHFSVPEHYQNQTRKCVYHQSQVWTNSGSEVKWAECSFIIGTSCRVQVFSAWSSIALSVCKWAFSLQAIMCLRLLRFESCIRQRQVICLLSIRNHFPVSEHYHNQTNMGYE